MTASAPSRPTWLTWLAGAVVILGFVNFLWFFAESAKAGDALNGYVRDGHYFLSSHGRVTEVSREAWEWSRVHALSVFVTHPLALLGGAYLLVTQAFPSMIGGSRRPDDRLHIVRILSSGDVLAATRTGGRLGGLRLSKGLVRVEVRPGGLVVSPFAMAPIGIEAADIVGVETRRARLGLSTIEVLYRPAGAPGIRLYLDENDPVVTAIHSIAPGPGEEDLASTAAQTGGASLRWAPSREPYSAAMKVMILAGFALAIVFAIVTIPIGSGLSRSDPIWAVGLVAIIAFNAYTYFVRNRDRW
jgi:hypothetical protein